MAVTEEVIKFLNKKKKSVLHPFLDDIRSLRESDVPLRGIQTWLKDQGVETTVENIRLYCKRNKIFVLNKTNKKVEVSAHDICINEKKKGSKITFLTEDKGV